MPRGRNPYECIVRGKTVTARQGQEGRLRPVLQAQHPARGRRGQGQQPRRRRRDAAGARIRRNARRPLRLQLERRRLPEHDRTGKAAPSSARSALDEFPSPESCGGATAPEGLTPEQEHRRRRTTTTTARPGAALLPAQRHQPHRRGHRQGPEPHPAGHGHRHRQDLHRLPDHLAAVEGRRKKRILFLADRNILGRPDQDQRLQAVRPGDDQDHQPHGRQVLRDLPLALPGHHRHRGRAEHLQAVLARLLRPDRHRRVPPGQRRRGLAWREILDYFSSATQIGLTATPKETEDVSNIDYFGEPVYTYSLKQGIEDGFLAPYKVVRIDLDKDLTAGGPKGASSTSTAGDRGPHLQPEGLRPHAGARERTELVAARSPSSSSGHRPLRQDHRLLRDIDHAERMRQALVNAQPDLAAENRKYVMRITGDNDEGKAELDNFIDPESPTRSSPPPRS
jgi:hypothetical protein